MSVVCEISSAVCPDKCPHKVPHEPIVDTYPITDTRGNIDYVDGPCSEIASECGWLGGVVGECKCVAVAPAPDARGASSDGNSQANGHALNDVIDSGKEKQGQ